MSTIVTRAGKGSPLTWNEVDNNFTNLNTDKYQSGSNVSLGTIAGTTITSSALTSGRVTFASTGGLLADSANLTFSGTTLSLNGLIRIDNGGNILGKSDNTGFPSIYGGGAYNSGAGIGLGGSSNSTLPNTILFTRGAYVESARIDSSGNLGLGVTPSAWQSTRKAAQVGVSSLSTINNNTFVGTNFYSDGTSKYIGTGVALLYGQESSGAHTWYNSPSGTAGNAITFTQAMTLDSSGNLGIGTASPARKLDVNGSIQLPTNNALYIKGSDNYFYADSSNTVEIAAGTSGKINFVTNGASRAILDSSGNLGLGVTPSAYTVGKAVEVGSAGNSLWGAGAGNVYLTTNTYYNGAYRYSVTGAAAYYVQNSGVHTWSNAPSGTAGNVATFTDRMTLDASGNLQIGTSSDSIAKLVLRGLHANNAVLWAGGTDANYTGFSVRPNSASNVTMLSSEWATATVALSFGLGGSEKMRIDSSGNLLVGTTSGGQKLVVKGDSGNAAASFLAANSSVGFYTTNTSGTGTYDGAQFLTNGGATAVGSISVTASSTAYVTSSDYRLKENIAPMTGALDTVAQLKPVTYNWKVDGSNGQGFIAHELAEVVPDCVTGEKDATKEEQYEISPAIPAVLDEEGNEVTPAVEAVMGTRTVPVYQGIDTSFLVATLTAAIQEQQAMIDELKAKVAALEAA